MARTCSLCGEFLTDIEDQQFSQYIKQKITSLVDISPIDLDNSTEILCEICKKPFCQRCFQNRMYNGKSLSKYVEIFDKKYNTLAKKTFVADQYVCQSCSLKESANKCHTCGKHLNQDKEGHFSAKHVGLHVECNHCHSLICLDCATQKDNPLKYQESCPFCEENKWLPVKADLLLDYYDKNIIYLNQRQGFACEQCGKEKSIMLVCKKRKCGKIYCPTCLLEHDPKLKGYCPSCTKKGFKNFRDDLESLAQSTVILPLHKELKKEKLPQNLDENQTELSAIEIIEPDQPVVDDSELDTLIETEISEDKVQKDQKIAQLDTELEIELEVDIEDEVDLYAEPLNIPEDLRRFTRVTNAIPDLREFLTGFKYTIQFNLEDHSGFYFYIKNGKISGYIGKYPNPTVYSDPLSHEQAKFILHALPEAEFSNLHGDLEIIEHFMDFHQLFDHLVHA